MNPVLLATEAVPPVTLVLSFSLWRQNLAVQSKLASRLGIVAHAFNPGTREAEANGSL